MRYIALAFDVAGAAAVVAGVWLWSVPAALVVAGFLCLAFSVSLERRK